VSIYAIGDVQGCYDELSRLLDRLKLDPAVDEVWFVGDLVNRGPKSLEVLRLVKQLGRSAMVTLGNHDLHLLALALTDRAPVKDDDLRDVLDAPDAAELIDWLRRHPLAHYRPEMNTLVVHAGVPPQWDPLQTIKLAREVEKILRSEAGPGFLEAMYGKEPGCWSNSLEGYDRLRYITNALTRIRLCGRDGRLELSQKGPPPEKPGDSLPWFDIDGRATANVRVVFGHWSALGLLQRQNLLGLDTGCVWGGTLTAARLDGPLQLTSEDSLGHRRPDA
jgi:bis(5'-nucleosyl)-tetraphosphatase (symmetrical)